MSKQTRTNYVIYLRSIIKWPYKKEFYKRLDKDLWHRKRSNQPSKVDGQMVHMSFEGSENI